MVAVPRSLRGMQMHPLASNHPARYREAAMPLPPEIESHLDALRQLAAECELVAVAVVGSAAREDFDPAKSDVDLLVDFGPYTDDLGARAVRFYTSVQKLFDRRVDIISTHGIRSDLWRSILEAGQVPVYAAA